jgi:hypothetical protein
MYDYGQHPTPPKVIEASEWMGENSTITGHDGQQVIISFGTKWEMLQLFVESSRGNTEVSHYIGVDILNVRPLATRMQEAGLIFYNGDRAPTDRGKTERVYSATPLGRAVAKKKS